MSDKSRTLSPGRALRPEVRMNKEQEEAVGASELKALRALVYDLESYFSDSGWQHLAREGSAAKNLGCWSRCICRERS